MIINFRNRNISRVDYYFLLAFIIKREFSLYFFGNFIKKQNKIQKVELNNVKKIVYIKELWYI